jgi:hypothetical protein
MRPTTWTVLFLVEKGVVLPLKYERGVLDFFMYQQTLLIARASTHSRLAPLHKQCLPRALSSDLPSVLEGEKQLER